jgi:hypothetical protein
MGIREWTVWPALKSRQGKSHEASTWGTASYRPLTRAVLVVQRLGTVFCRTVSPALETYSGHVTARLATMSVA